MKKIEKSNAGFEKPFQLVYMADRSTRGMSRREVEEVETPFLGICMSEAQAKRRQERMQENRKNEKKRKAARFLMLEVVILAAALGAWTWSLLQVI